MPLPASFKTRKRSFRTHSRSLRSIIEQALKLLATDAELEGLAIEMRDMREGLGVLGMRLWGVLERKARKE